MVSLGRPGPAAHAVAMGVAAFAFMLAIWHAQPTGFNNYVFLADAWKHGRNWIDFPGDFIDAMPYHGRAYVIEGPVPALLLFPIVMVFGMSANQTLVSNALGALGVYAAYRLCDRFGLGRLESVAATLFAFFGTSFFVCATNGSVWFLGHAAAFAFSMLALCEVFGQRRAWLVAAWGLCATFSRYPMVVALPLYLLLLVERDWRREVFESFIAPVVPAAIASMLYNQSRWGTLYDGGFQMFYRIMDAQSKSRPDTFSVAYLPSQLKMFLQTPPRVIASFPWIVPPYFGFSLPWTSAPFAYAIFAGLNFEAIVLWVATIATALPALLYYGSGDGQFGVRHALDFEPFLFVLLIMAMRARPSPIVTYALFAFAAAGVYGGVIWLLWPQLTL